MFVRAAARRRKNLWTRLTRPIVARTCTRLALLLAVFGCLLSAPKVFNQRERHLLGQIDYGKCLKDRHSECVFRNVVLLKSELLLLTKTTKTQTFKINTGYSLGPRLFVTLRQVRRIPVQSTLRVIRNPVAMFSLGHPSIYGWYLGLAAGMHVLRKHFPDCQDFRLFPWDFDAYGNTSTILKNVDTRLLFLAKESDYMSQPILFQRLVLSFADDFSRIPETSRYQMTDKIDDVKKSWLAVQSAVGLQRYLNAHETTKTKAVLLRREGNSCLNGEVHKPESCKRLIKNEDDVHRAISQYFDVIIIDQNASPNELQIQLQDVSVLIGMHGQGLGLQMYMQNATIIELFPYTFQKQVYYNMATLLGHNYLYWRNTIEENVRGFTCKSLYAEPDYSSMRWKNCFRNTDTIVDIKSFNSVLRLAKWRLKYLVVDDYPSSIDLLSDLEMLCSLSLRVNRTLILPCLKTESQHTDCAFLEKTFNANKLYASNCNLASAENAPYNLRMMDVHGNTTWSNAVTMSNEAGFDFVEMGSFLEAFTRFAVTHPAEVVRIESSCLKRLRSNYQQSTNSRQVIVQFDDRIVHTVLEQNPCKKQLTSVSVAALSHVRYKHPWWALSAAFQHLLTRGTLHVVERSLGMTHDGETTRDSRLSAVDSFVPEAITAVYCARNFVGCERLTLSRYISYWRKQKGKSSDMYSCN